MPDVKKGDAVYCEGRLHKLHNFIKSEYGKVTYINTDNGEVVVKYGDGDADTVSPDHFIWDKENNRWSVE